ncbi:MAG: TRAP transporter substrate-binding protein [Oscillospiraceae bacterium]
MKKAISLLLVAVLCVGLLAGCGSSKDDEVYNLVVVNHDASTSMCEEYIETLCKQMEEASGGRLTFTFNPGGSLLGATETLDGVKDGTADICWSCTSFFGGRFPISEFINLCANGITSARMATEVYNKMYAEMPELQKEMSGWKIIALHSCAYGPISTVGTKIETPDDFKGLQIRTAGTVAAKYISALGANPITVPTSDVYDSVSKHVIDGFTNDWHNIDCFKLYEPIDYCLDLPVSYTSCFVMMNQEKYDSLPEDLQAIIDQYCGGYAGAMAGYWWDSCNYWVADKMRENGVEVYKPSDELYAWATSDEIVGPIHEWYIQYLNDAGLDGQAIYDKCMEIVSEVAPAHANDWDSEFNYKDWNSTPDNWEY